MTEEELLDLSEKYLFGGEFALPTNDSILKSLNDGNLFEIIKDEDNFLFIDNVDNYFGMILDRDQVSELISELQGLLDT
jgi:hypothetical protein